MQLEDGSKTETPSRKIRELLKLLWRKLYTRKNATISDGTNTTHLSDCGNIRLKDGVFDDIILPYERFYRGYRSEKTSVDEKIELAIANVNSCSGNTFICSDITDTETHNMSDKGPFITRWNQDIVCRFSNSREQSMKPMRIPIYCQNNSFTESVKSNTFMGDT